MGRILFVDDNEAIRVMAKKIIYHLGYTATVSDNYHQALDLYKQALETDSPFDLIIMDLTMPGSLGGIETIALLQEIDPEIKAVVSSGYSNDPIMADYRTFGFCGVIPKPYTIEKFSKVLAETIL